MGYADNKASIIHNTYRIIAANAPACELFRCEEDDLIDQDMLEMVADEDMRGLAALRLSQVRIHDLSAQELPLWRPDGSKFFARVKTTKLADKLFETELEYLREM